MSENHKSKRSQAQSGEEAKAALAKLAAKLLFSSDLKAEELRGLLVEGGINGPGELRAILDRAAIEGEKEPPNDR